MAATDAHAKNYSIMLSLEGEHELAPMYDAASIAPPYIVDPGSWEIGPPKLAMSIGGENRAGRVSVGNLDKLVEQCGLERFGITGLGCRNLLVSYARAIPEQMTEVFDSLQNTATAAAATELRARMEDPIRRLCSRSADRLER